MNIRTGIKKLPISSQSGYHFECKALQKWGANLEAWAAHTQPVPTQLPALPHPLKPSAVTQIHTSH